MKLINVNILDDRAGQVSNKILFSSQLLDSVYELK